MLNKRILVFMFLLIFLPLVGCLPSPTNQAPIITSTPITTATVGVAYTYDVNATDPDGDTLTYSLDVMPSGMTINSATGLIEWTPTAEGDYAVVVKVSDGALDITQSFTIEVIEEEGPGWTPTPPSPPPFNHAPVITSIPGDTAIVGVKYTYTVKATDPEGDAITYSLTTKPGGMAIVPATGVISWIPAAVGNYGVVVKASDGKLSDTQSFTIVVVENQPPTADAGPDRIVVMETMVEITFVGTGTDPDGTVVSYSWDFDDTFTGTGAIVGHTYGALGAYNVTLTVTDNLGATDSDIMSLKIFDTIQDGIDAYNPVNLIEVMAGTYNEDVTIDKSLTLLGAQAGECAIGRIGEESEIVGSIYVSSNAKDFTINGFKVTTGVCCMTIWSASATIMNNIFVEEPPGAYITNFVELNGVSNADIKCNDFSGRYDAGRRPSVLRLGINGAGTVTVANNEMHDVGGGGGIGIMCTDASAVIEITDNVIDNTGDGIWTYNSTFDTLLITGNDVLNNAGINQHNQGPNLGINIAVGVTGDVQIHDNNIEDNEYGVFNDSSNAAVNATNNWWGDASGPYHPISNPLGTGDAVSDNVGYSPWSTSAY